MDRRNTETSPGPLDTTMAQMTTSRKDIDHGTVLPPPDVSVVAGSSQKHQGRNNGNLKNKLRIVHITELPLQTDYDTLQKSFEKYGKISEIRMRLNDETERYDAWIVYSRYEDAFSAICDINNINIDDETVNGALCDKIPSNLDVYRPADWDGENSQTETSCSRKPKPPMWITATAQGDNENYFKICKFLQKKVGYIKTGDIT